MSDLDCAVCLHQTNGNTSTHAVTVANGQAVCLEHFDEIRNMYDQTRGNISLAQMTWFKESAS